MDVKRAADLYAQGRSLRQIGAELGVTATTVGNQLRRAGVSMRRGGPPAHPASIQQILELRDRGFVPPRAGDCGLLGFNLISARGVMIAR